MIDQVVVKLINYNKCLNSWVFDLVAPEKSIPFKEASHTKVGQLHHLFWQKTSILLLPKIVHCTRKTNAIIQQI